MFQFIPGMIYQFTFSVDTFVQSMNVLELVRPAGNQKLCVEEGKFQLKGMQFVDFIWFCCLLL